MNDNDGSRAASSTTKIPSSSEATTTKKSITKEEIRELPLVSWNGPIEFLDEEESMVGAVDRILKECASEKEECVLGFDIESRPVFRKGQWNPPALVQIATPTRVYLFRVSKNRNCSLGPLLPIFESPVLKCGVSITFDVLDLLKVRNFTPRGFVELQSLVRQLGYRQSGLRNLAAMLIGKRISKGAQMTNWEKPVLKEKELLYAATDAWLGREIYLLACAQQAREGKSLSGEERLVFTKRGELVRKEKDPSKEKKKKKA